MTNKDKFLKEKQTSANRKLMTCKVFELKISSNKLSKQQIEFLQMNFIEAKWLYNYILSQDDVFHIDGKLKFVNVLNKDHVFEERSLNFLSAQSKQEIIKRIHTSIKSLSTKKKKGKSKEVGRLKFKSEVNSVPLKQYGISYKLDFVSNTLKLSGLKKSLKVKGFNQFKNISGLEFANANLIKRQNDYFIKVTTFQPRKNNMSKLSQIAVGLDFGIATDLTLSNELKFITKLPVSEGVKKSQRKLSRKVKGSKNYIKEKYKLQKQYRKQTNKKEDATNKLVSYLKSNYDYIAVQDENIKGWHHGRFGKQVQQSILGGIISKVKQLPQTHLVDRWFPSTKLCMQCGTLNVLTLADRTYKCSCGCVESDRDVHAAQNILMKSLLDDGLISLDHLNNDILPMERRFKPVEFSVTSIENLKKLFKGTIVNMNVESGRYNSLELC